MTNGGNVVRKGIYDSDSARTFEGSLLRPSNNARCPIATVF